MALPAESKFDTVVDQALTLEAVAYAHFGEKLDGALLQHAGAHAFFDVLARVHFQHHGIDPIQVQKVRKNEPGWTGPDDTYLRALSHQAFNQPKPQESV